MRSDLAKFGTTVARRCIEDKFTLSGLHASLISATTISFSSGTLLDKQEPKWKELAKYSTHFGFKLEELEDNWTWLRKFWPYPEAKTSAPSMRLKAGHPSNHFFKFVSAALQTYPAQALASNRRGSDGHLLLGVFLAAYYAEGVTAGYFNVHGPSDLRIKAHAVTLKSQDGNAKTFSHAANRLRDGLTDVIGESLSGDKGKAKEFTWIDQIAVIALPKVSEREDAGEKAKMKRDLAQRASADKMRKSLHKVRRAIIQTGIVGGGKSLDKEVAGAVDNLLTVRESSQWY
jgi:hypothetical protein